jgi:glycosyltransferase involved in cell wall biosynthesis
VDGNRRLKVLTVTDSLPSIGGAERLAAKLTAGLDPGRFERILCATRPTSGALVEEVVASGVRFVELQRRSRVHVAAWRPLVALLRSERVDVVHAHQFGSNVWGSLLARSTGVPVVVAHDHNWSFEGEPLRRLLDRELIARFADVFVAVSTSARRRMVELEGIDPRIVRVIPNGIAPLQPTSGREIRGELGIPPDAPVVGTVTVLRPEKALHVLIRAAELLAREFAGLHVVIVGIGPEQTALQALVRELRLEASVRFVGHRSDVPDLLEAFDVAVSCSDFEGAPLAVIEYMAAAKPIVATRVGGTPELIEDGRHGVLVERRDPPELARAIAALLHDRRRGAELGAQARERQQREFDIGGQIQRIEDLYEALFLATERARRERSTAPATRPR